eukprot:6628971-Prymnesium_polylepis.1
MSALILLCGSARHVAGRAAHWQRPARFRRAGRTLGEAAGCVKATVARCDRIDHVAAHNRIAAPTTHLFVRRSVYRYWR